MENTIITLVIVLLLLAIFVSLLTISKKVEAWWKLKIVADSGATEAEEKFRTTLLEKFDLSLKSITERIDHIHQFIGSVPYHNTTFYFNYKGEPLNLNIEKWRLEIEQDPKQYIKDNAVGKLIVYIRRSEIIFDKFTLDFKNFDKNHKSFPVVEFGIKLMKESQLNYAQLSFEMLKELVEGVYSRGVIYHQQLANMLIYSFIQHVTPYYEIDQANIKHEEEVKNQVTERTATGEIEYKCKIGEDISEYAVCSKDRAEYDAKCNVGIYDYLGQGDIYECPESLDQYTKLHFWAHKKQIQAGIDKTVNDGIIEESAARDLQTVVDTLLSPAVEEVANQAKVFEISNGVNHQEA
jgi:hypothetical protein